MDTDMIFDDAGSPADGDHGPEHVTFSVRMPTDLYHGLVRSARENGLTRACLLRLLVKRMLADR